MGTHINDSSFEAWISDCRRSNKKAPLKAKGVFE
jgi:hypothetical protein